MTGCERLSANASSAWARIDAASFALCIATLSVGMMETRQPSSGVSQDAQSSCRLSGSIGSNQHRRTRPGLEKDAQDSREHRMCKACVYLQMLQVGASGKYGWARGGCLPDANVATLMQAVEAHLRVRSFDSQSSCHQLKKVRHMLLLRRGCGPAQRHAHSHTQPGTASGHGWSYLRGNAETWPDAVGSGWAAQGTAGLSLLGLTGEQAREELLPRCRRPGQTDELTAGISRTVTSSRTISLPRSFWGRAAVGSARGLSNGKPDKTKATLTRCITLKTEAVSYQSNISEMQSLLHLPRLAAKQSQADVAGFGSRGQSSPGGGPLDASLQPFPSCVDLSPGRGWQGVSARMPPVAGTAGAVNGFGGNGGPLLGFGGRPDEGGSAIGRSPGLTALRPCSGGVSG